MKVKKLVVHPLGDIIFNKMGQRRTLKLLKRLKTKEVEFFVENLENHHFSKKIGINLSCFRSMREWYEFGEEHDFNLCLDVTHCLSFDEDPIEIFELYKDRIKHIHLSDYKDGKMHLNLGEGVFDYKEFFRVLKKNKYDGDVVLELNPGMENLAKHNLEMIKIAMK